MNRADRRRRQRSEKKAAASRVRKTPSSENGAAGNTAIDGMKLIEAVHAGADIPKHTDILHADDMVGQLPFLKLYQDCIDASGTTMESWKSLRRIGRARNLARYFNYSLGLGGAAIECGVYKGFSALLMARIWQAKDLAFSGKGLHIVDSFAGLSPPVVDDLVDNGQPDEGVLYHQAGHFAVPLEHVRDVLSGYPDIMAYKGWIPEVLSHIPDQTWSFVHIDVDLYEPTKAAAEYFLPRLAPGGIMINDDFDSPLFPGGGSGWREALGDRSYAVLDTGQAVYIHNA